MLARGRRVPFAELGDALERYGAEGPAPFYRGEIAERVSEWVVERGGTLGADDLAAYEPSSREPGAGRATAGATCSPTRRPPRAAS